MSTPLTYQFADGIATLRMDDGKANVWGFAMMEAMNAALDKAEAEQAVVVLTGRAGMFSGGFDLAVFKAGGPEVGRMLQTGAAILERLVKCPRPVMAAVSGHAVAMGALSLCAFDVRLCVAEGARIQLNETAIGLPMPYFGLALGRARLSVPHQSLAMLSAEPYTPAGAVAAGYLDATAPAADFEAAVLARAQTLAKLEPKAFAETKRRLNASLLEALVTANALDAKVFAAMAAGA
jgi:enoyl-CoA hydratase